MDMLNDIFNAIPSIPTLTPEVNLLLRTILMGCGIILALSVVCRLLLGRRSSVNHTFSSVMGILSLYVLGVLLYQSSLHISTLLDVLPFVSVQEDQLVIFTFANASFPQICGQLLSAFILAFLMSLMDTVIPAGKHLVLWLLFRCATLLAAFFILAFLLWISNTYLPKDFQIWTPAILVVTLLASMFLSLLKPFLGAAAAATPLLSGFYGFFFAALVGKQITKAVSTTLLLSLLVIALNYFGIHLILLSSLSICVMIPVVLGLLGLWYLIGHIL